MRAKKKKESSSGREKGFILASGPIIFLKFSESPPESDEKKSAGGGVKKFHPYSNFVPHPRNLMVRPESDHQTFCVFQAEYTVPALGLIIQ